MSLLLYPIRVVNGIIGFIGDLGYLIRDTFAATHVALFTGRSKKQGWANLWTQMDRVGVRSIGIVSLVMFCIGAILALQMAPLLKGFGVVDRVADIISIATFRELGPLVSAVVLTGFAGASIAAEIGTMVVSEEIEALEAGAINPIRFLVVPRVIATTVMMVCVAVVGDVMVIFGGWLVAVGLLDIGPMQYVHRTLDILKLSDFLTGLVKAAVFGMLISSMACYLGMTVTGGAMGVGRATTRTVVLTIVALITVDLIFTSVLYTLGW
jgi:phospholipid/cholesterol/gamma-HCH transport system permease protein